MGFASGAVSFRRFAVVGQHPKEITQEVIEMLEAHVLREREIGVPEEVEYGWCGGRHILDGQFSFEHNVFNDALHFAMRVDTNKAPAALKKAYRLMEEEAVARTNPSGFISKRQKRDVKDVVSRKLDEELKSGRFRRSKLVPMMWDFRMRTLYAPASGSTLEKLHELFSRSFGLELEPLSAGSAALRQLEHVGKRHEYEDSRPTRFVIGPEGEGQRAEYPWTAKGAQPKDFLGNEFLLWLWHQVEAHGGEVKTEKGEVAIVIDKLLELDCAYGQTGKDSLRGDGPTRMPEARDALRSGKMPRRCGMIMATGGKQFEFTLNTETLGVNGCKMPDVEAEEGKDGPDARGIFEERVDMLRDLCGGMDALFAAFLKGRAGSGWESQVSGIRRWIMQSAKQPAVAVA